MNKRLGDQIGETYLQQKGALTASPLKAELQALLGPMLYTSEP
jgi:hypothetical protein